MRVAIRVDASISIGTGHVMRCLTLADALCKRGASVIFLCRLHEGNPCSMLKQRGYEVVELPLRTEIVADGRLEHSAWLGASQSQDAADCGAAIAEMQAIDWLVVDHYALDAEWEVALRRYVPRVLSIDDLADRNHDCDALLDQNIYNNAESRYVGRVPEKCRLFLGPHYALLREEFDHALDLRKRADHAVLRRVLILFGGIDLGNDTLSAIKVVEQLHAAQLDVDVVVAPRNAHAEEIRKYCASRPQFRLHFSPSNLAELMANSDLAIGAGGTTTFERLYLRLPALLKPVSANQEAPLSDMSRMGLFSLFGDSDQLAAQLRLRLQEGVTAPPVCVENGTEALVRLLMQNEVELRQPQPYDLRRTFNWLQDQRLRTDFMVADAPRRQGHFRYWRLLLADSTQRVFSIIDCGRHVGNCGLKNIEPENGIAELWIYLGDPQVRGRGIGRIAVQLLLKHFSTQLQGRKVYLHLRRDNTAARALYKATGFSDCSEPLVGAWAGRDAEMLRMEIAL